MNFNTRWNTLSAIFLAASFFLRVIEYSVISDASGAGTSALIFSLILPLVLLMAGLVLLRVVRLRHPLIYAVLGACLCLLVMCSNFGSGNALRIVFSVLWYLFCSALLVGTALGYVPWNLPVSAALMMAFVVRFLFYSRAVAGLGNKLIEFSMLAVILSAFCLTRCFVEDKMDT